MLQLLNITTWPWYKRFDVAVLRRINQEWTNPVLDTILPWCRESLVWIPFYLFLLAFAFINLGRTAWYWVLGLVVTVTASDQISSGIIKNWVARERPCRDPEVASLINLRIEHCSGAYSFTSSHAANHFAIATFVILTMTPLVGKHTRWLLLWAGIISYAQMYVGVHYPLDILGGTLVGLIVGYASGQLYNRMVGLPPQEIATLNKA